MKIGIPKEVKQDEFRVGLTPFNTAQLIDDGHIVYIQKGAGVGSGFSDQEYIDSGAIIVNSAKELYGSSKLIVKVKEPQSSEYDFLNETHTLFCYFHLAPLKDLAVTLMEKKVCAIAYETVSLNGQLPLLKPMSDIAGKISVMMGAYHLGVYQDGNGVLIGGTVGVAPAKVLIIGAGNAGYNAAKVAVGMGADVTVMNRSTPKLQELQNHLPSVKTLVYSPKALNECLKQTDIVISSVLIHGGAMTPKLITRDMLKSMKKGTVLIDITIDQGGISEASHPTTHTNPVFVEEGVIHYCVANMPGAYAKTATQALTNATFPYIRKMANDGVNESLKDDMALAEGVNVYKGYITKTAVAQKLQLDFKELGELI